MIICVSHWGINQEEAKNRIFYLYRYCLFSLFALFNILIIGFIETTIRWSGRGSLFIFSSFWSNNCFILLYCYGKIFLKSLESCQKFLIQVNIISEECKFIILKIYYICRYGGESSFKPCPSKQQERMDMESFFHMLFHLRWFYHKCVWFVRSIFLN